MRIVIIGATGFIGQKLFIFLQQEAHDLTIVTRDAENARQRLGENAIFKEWDTRNQEVLNDIIEGSHAVINLGGENISSSLWTKAQKRKILESRLSISRAVVEAINQASLKPEVVIQASAIGFYGSNNEAEFTEQSPAGSGFLADVTRQWEACTDKLPADVRLVLLRTGIVLEADGGALPAMARPFRLGFGGHIGNGKQWLSWIHLDDEVRAIHFLLENKHAAGVFNLTAPEAVRYHDFAKELGRVMKRRSWAHVPAFIVKMTMGRMGTEMLLASQKVIPQKLQDLDFKFQFTDLRLALTSIFNS